MKKNTRISLMSALAAGLLLSSCGEKYTSETKDGLTMISNEEGAQLGLSSESGVKVIAKDRYAFKDLNKNGSLDAYEDWRLPVNERAKIWLPK